MRPTYNPKGGALGAEWLKPALIFGSGFHSHVLDDQVRDDYREVLWD